MATVADLEKVLTTLKADTDANQIAQAAGIASIKDLLARLATGIANSIPQSALDSIVTQAQAEVVQIEASTKAMQDAVASAVPPP